MLVDIERAKPWVGAGYLPDGDSEDMDVEGRGVVRQRAVVRAHGVALPPGASRHGGQAYGGQESNET